GVGTGGGGNNARRRARGGAGPTALREPAHPPPRGPACPGGGNLSDDRHSTFLEDTPMRGLPVIMALLIGGIVAGASAEQKQVAPGCEKVAAAMDEAGGALSADEVAKKTSRDVETVRGCMDAWRASQKDAKGGASGSTGQHAVSPGCAKVVSVLEQQPGLSAEEIALKTMTNVQTVRGCTDQYRAMKGGAKP